MKTESSSSSSRSGESRRQSERSSQDKPSSSKDKPRSAQDKPSSTQEKPRSAQEASRSVQQQARTQPASRPVRQATQSTFEAQRPRRGPALTDTKPPATHVQPRATNLLNENTRDASVNCLDRAADWVDKASPELRARSEVVLLEDTRAGREGQTGHVVIRQGERVMDPSTGQSYASMQDFQRAQPQYREAGSLPATAAHRIFSTEPGTPERAQALAQAHVPESLSRMMVADTAATAPRTLNPASVARAEADFAQVSQLHHLGQPNAMGELLLANKNDPDYQAHLVGLMNQGKPESMLNNVVAGFEGLFVKSGAGEFGGTEETLNAVAGALSAAKQAGTLSEADLQAYVDRAPAPWGEAVSRMGFSPVERLPAADTAMRELQGAVGEYESALQAVEGRNEELAAQLSAFGPALTEQQKADFIKAYQNHPDNAAVFQRLESAAANLARVVERQGPALENAAITRPADAQRLGDALAHLATSSQAATAVKMGARILADPASPLGQAFAAVPDFEKRVMEQGIPNAAAQIMALAATPQDGLRQLKELLAPLAEAGSGLKDGYETIQEGLDAIESAINGNYNRLDVLAQDFAESSPLARGMAVAGIVFGAASAVNAGREGNYLEMLNGLASTGQDGLELLAGATEALTRSGRLAQYGVDAAQASRFASFATKLAPALGLVANATSFAMHFNDLRDDPNIGEAVALMGDAIGVLGSAIELIPGGQPVGIVVNGVGAVISTLGDAASWLLERHEFTSQQREFLQQAGVKEPLLSTLMDSDGERVRELVDELKITPEQVQRLAVEMPWLLTEGSNNGLNLDNFVRMTQAFGITGTEAYDLLRGMGTGAEDPQHNTYVVLANLMREGHGAQTQADWRSVVSRLAQSMPADLKPGFENLARELREHTRP